MRPVIFQVGMLSMACSAFGEPYDVSNRVHPVTNPAIVSPAELVPLPARQVVQHYVVGQGIVEGAVAGATGVEIFHNDVSKLNAPWQPGAGIQMADDMRIPCYTATSATFIEITVTGGGDGSGPGFQVEFQLYDRCPHDETSPGQPIAGTHHTANLPNDGLFAVALDVGGAPVPIPANFWLAATFSTDSAGWMIGDDPSIGDSNGGTFDGPFGCSTTFGGCGVACANFAARIFGTVCETETHLAYRATSSFNVFFGLDDTPNLMAADDVLPIDAPDHCAVSAYRPGMSGPFGPYGARFEVFSNEEEENIPLAPVLGTLCIKQGLGDGTLEIMQCDVQPAAEVPSERLWITYQWIAPFNLNGPVLLSSPPDIGFGADCFSIFGDPEVGEWSPCQWFFGGCDDPEEGNPCATFYNSVDCLGLEPRGACCDLLTPGTDNCVNDVFTSQCNGRFENNMECGATTFDPPCGTGSCCKPDQSCENLTATACLQQNGLWRPALSCNDEDFTCPFPSCFTATESCTVIHEESGGCNDTACCETVCNTDSFCCEVAWDSNCVTIAMDFCVFQPPSNNECINARVVNEGTFAINTFSASTDGPTLPPGPQPNGCDEGSGVALVNDIWFQYTAPENGIVTLDLCSDSDLDSRVVAYSSCTCPVTQGQTVECADDGCQISDGPTVLQFPVNEGQCYRIRVGGAPGPNSSGLGTMTVSFSGTGPSCPDGAAVFTNPMNNTVDARQPHPVNSFTPRQGIQTITVTAPEGVDASCFTMCETASVPGQPNSITNVAANGTTYTLTLARPITPGAVTRVAYEPDAGAATIATFISHPGNVNGDSTAAALDILRVIDCVNMVMPNVNCPWGIYSRDIDNSGVLSAPDILRVIDLLNGADLYDPWINTALPSATCTP